jgi:hypothetical protein
MKFGKEVSKIALFRFKGKALNETLILSPGSDDNNKHPVYVQVDRVQSCIPFFDELIRQSAYEDNGSEESGYESPGSNLPFVPFTARV